LRVPTNVFKNHELSASSMAIMQCGPTYSMAKAIGATAWQKGFICDAILIFALPHTVVEVVTWTDLSNGHIDEGYRMS